MFSQGSQNPIFATSLILFPWLRKAEGADDGCESSVEEVP